MTIQEVLHHPNYLTYDEWIRPVSWRGSGRAIDTMDGEHLIVRPGQIPASLTIQEVCGEWETIHADNLYRERRGA